jgi:hypothetical protein
MRRMKHAFLLTTVGLFVLVGAAAAVQPRPQTTDVSAAFTADQTRSHSRTCTRNGTTFRITNAVWRGTSTGDDTRLAGNVTIATRTVVNESSGDGWLTGTWRSVGTSQMQPGRPGRPRSHGNLHAVIDNGNHADGLVTGEVRAPYGRLLGNWSATIVGNTIAGAIGANSPVAPDNSALIYLGGC